MTQDPACWTSSVEYRKTIVLNYTTKTNDSTTKIHTRQCSFMDDSFHYNTEKFILWLPQKCSKQTENEAENHSFPSHQIHPFQNKIASVHPTPLNCHAIETPHKSCLSISTRKSLQPQSRRRETISSSVLFSIPVHCRGRLFQGLRQVYGSNQHLSYSHSLRYGAEIHHDC